MEDFSKNWTVDGDGNDKGFNYGERERVGQNRNLKF